MANERYSGKYYEYALVEVAPDSDGFWTNEVIPRELLQEGYTKLYFSIREAYPSVSEVASVSSDVVVSLQFKCEGDTDWTDYVPLDGSTFAVGNRVLLDDFARGLVWRAGVKSDGYVSGSVLFGFDW